MLHSNEWLYHFHIALPAHWKIMLSCFSGGLKHCCFIYLFSGRAIKRIKMLVKWIKDCFCTPRWMRVATGSDLVNCHQPLHFTLPSFEGLLSGAVFLSHVISHKVSFSTASPTRYGIIYSDSLLDPPSYSNTRYSHPFVSSSMKWENLFPWKAYKIL